MCCHCCHLSCSEATPESRMVTGRCRCCHCCHGHSVHVKTGCGSSGTPVAVEPVRVHHEKAAIAGPGRRWFFCRRPASALTSTSWVSRGRRTRSRPWPLAASSTPRAAPPGGELWVVVDLVRQYGSSGQIARTLKHMPPIDSRRRVSHEATYNALYIISREGAAIPVTSPQEARRPYR